MNRPLSLRFLGGAAALVLPGLVTGAQPDVVVPATYVQVDAPSLTTIAGFTQRGRQQILIDASELTPLATRGVRALVFRRDGAHLRALGAGAADIVVRISSLARAPAAASPVFAINHGGTVTEVFRGRVSLP